MNLATAEIVYRASTGLIIAIVLLIIYGMMNRESQGRGIGARFSYFMIVMTAVLCTTLLAVLGTLTPQAAAILAAAAGLTVYRYWVSGTGD